MLRLRLALNPSEANVFLPSKFDSIFIMHFADWVVLGNLILPQPSLQLRPCQSAKKSWLPVRPYVSISP